MKNKLIKLFFLLLRKMNDGFPTRAEVKFLLNASNRTYVRNVALSVVRYKNGLEIEDIAKSLQCSQIRVKGLVEKGVAQTWEDLIPSNKPE